MTIPKSKKELKLTAEKIMAEKLCKCIKKIGDEPRSIGICTKTIFIPKGIHRGTFKCRGKRNVEMTKRNKRNLKF